MSENFPKLGADLAMKIHEANRSPQISIQNNPLKIHHNKTVKNQKQREFLKHRREIISLTQGNPY